MRFHRIVASTIEAFELAAEPQFSEGVLHRFVALRTNYMSGDSSADWAVEGVPNSIMLAKPFAPAQLVTAISQLLTSASS
jgi:hypothetical protein